MSQFLFNTCRMSVTLVFVLALAVPSSALTVNRRVDCPQHTFTTGGFFPYSEDGYDLHGNTQLIGSAWTPILTPCAASGGFNIDQHPAASTNLIFHQWLKFRGVSPAPPNGTDVWYQVQFLLDGVSIAQYDRKYNGLPLQADSFAATAKNVVGAHHAFTVNVRTMTPGYSIVFTQAIGTAQGVPSTFQSEVQIASTAISSTPGGWMQAMSNVPISVPSGQNWDVLARGYMRISAPAGHRLSMSIALDSTSYVVELASPGPNGDTINLFDHFNGVLPSSPAHNLSMWIIDRDGGVVTATNRRLEYVATPQSNMVDIMAFSHAEDTRTISSTTTEPQPLLNISGCGNWTDVLSFTMPPSTPGSSVNWIIDGYVQLLGSLTGNWSLPNAEIAIEVRVPPAAGGSVIEAGWKELPVTATPTGFYFFGDAGSYGNAGNEIHLWLRKIACGSGNGSFQVGKRMLGIKLIGSDATSLTSGCEPFTFTNVPTAPFSTSGASSTIGVNGGTDGCNWTATSTASWLTITSGSGVGPGTIAYTVAANTGAARSANIVIGPQTITIAQN